jgi:uncharacterized protein (TIGR02246 family)
MATHTLIGELDAGKLFDAWAEALASGETGRVTALYAPDAVLLPTLSNRMRRNTAEIADYFHEFLLGGPRARVLDEIVRTMGDVAVHSGIYRFTMTALKGRPEIDARFTFVYEWQEHDWKIVAHHSSVMPAT